MLSRKLLLAFFLLLTLTRCFAVIEEASIPIFAVTESEDRAVRAELTIKIVPGSGKIWSSVGPLVGTSTQHTEKIAVELAKNYSDEVEKYDYMFDINSTASVVEGPSAGAAMALLLITMLQDKKLPGYVAITGQISEDGSIGSVGGIFLKAEKAAQTGIKLFMIPKGDAYQTHRFPDGIKTVNLVEYAPKEWGMKVVEVSNIDEALAYAFTPLEKIDINTQVKEQKPFAPEVIPLKDKLKPMKSLTSKYIEKAEETIDAAKDALNNSKLLDQQVISVLLQSLTNSQKNIEKAKLLYEANYLYSAANYAFVSLVNARLVKDLAENPSLLKSDSVLLKSLVSQLGEKIEELSKQLDKFYTIERFEWLVAAKERISWAELNLNKIKNIKTVIITNTGITEGISVPLKNLQDYEFALGWYEIASDFYNIAKEANDKFQAEPFLEEEARMYIIKAENCVATLYEEDEDISRRLEAARFEFKKEWYDAALFDAASAYGLCSSHEETKGKSLSELISTLEEKITAVKNKLLHDKGAVWPELYITHAEYFLKSAKHYKEEKAFSKAIEDAKAGISLALFAKELLDASLDARNKLVKISRKPFAEELPEITPELPSPDEQESPINKFAMNVGIVISILILLCFLIAILILFIKRQDYEKAAGEKEVLKGKINTIENMLKELDKRFMRNKITKQEYLSRKNVYEKQLRALKEELSRKSKHLLEIDRIRAQLKEVQFMLDQIKAQYEAGELLEEDYRKAFSKYLSKLEKLKEELAVEEQELAQEKKKIEKLANFPKRGKQKVLSKAYKSRSKRR